MCTNFHQAFCLGAHLISSVLKDQLWIKTTAYRIVHCYFCLPKTGLFCAQALDVALKAALKGELEDVVLGLLRTPAQYDAEQLKLAMKVMPCPVRDSSQCIHFGHNGQAIFNSKYSER